jgi:glycine dehydrogenase subunit 2
LAGVPVSRLEPKSRRSTNLIVLAATELTTDDDIAAPIACRRVRRNCNEHEQRRASHRHRHRASVLTLGSALLPNEPLLFEIGDREHSGVDLPDVADRRQLLGGFERKSEIDLARLTEPEAMRHYVRLSRLNYSIDSGMYPLGSCTMKHNPRLNEKMARLPGFADIHPLQPVSTVQGALELMDELAHWLMTLTNTAAVCADAQGRRAWRDGRHDGHQGGAGCRRAGPPQGRAGARERPRHQPGHRGLPRLHREADPARDDGTVDVEAVKAALSPDVAAIMLTNPNTCGLFEPEVIEIAAAVHEAGAFFYCDGANFNAIMGVVRPGDLGIDAMHINLHKTFSTPHGGGGPGAGPVVLSEALAPFAPVPFVRAPTSWNWSSMPKASTSAASPRSRARWACMSARSPTC